MNDIREWILAGRPPLEEPLLRTRKPRPNAIPSRAAEDESFADIAIRRDAIRQANHRGADRHRLENEVAEITHAGRRQTVTLVNLSGGGAMIEGAEDLRLWDIVAIRLGDCGEIDASVRWLRGNRIGLEFAQETRIDSPRHETIGMLQAIVRRSYPDFLPAPDAAPDQPAEPPAVTPYEKSERETRHPLIWSGLIHCDHESFPVRLRNVSEGGALVECDRTLRVGAELLLDLDKAGSFFARVSWARGDAAGLRFHERFDLQQLASARHALAPGRWIAPDHLRRNTGASASAWSKPAASGTSRLRGSFPR